MGMWQIIGLVVAVHVLSTPVVLFWLWLDTHRTPCEPVAPFRPAVPPQVNPEQQAADPAAPSRVRQPALMCS